MCCVIWRHKIWRRYVILYILELSHFFCYTHSKCFWTGVTWAEKSDVTNFYEILLSRHFKFTKHDIVGYFDEIWFLSFYRCYDYIRIIQYIDKHLIIYAISMWITVTSHSARCRVKASILMRQPDVGRSYCNVSECIHKSSDHIVAWFTLFLCFWKPPVYRCLRFYTYMFIKTLKIKLSTGLSPLLSYRSLTPNLRVLDKVSYAVKLRHHK